MITLSWGFYNFHTLTPLIKSKLHPAREILSTKNLNFLSSSLFFDKQSIFYELEFGLLSLLAYQFKSLLPSTL